MQVPPLSCLHDHGDQYLGFVADAAFEGPEALIDRDELDNSRPGVNQVLERRSNLQDKALRIWFMGPSVIFPATMVGASTI